MGRASGRFALIVTVLLTGTASAQKPPSFAPPPDLGAGFDPSMLGAPPKPPPPAVPPAGALVVPPPKIWCGGIELGMSGSTGNSEVFRVRFGTNAKRTTDTNVLTMDFLYGLSRIAGRYTENKALLLVRDEIALGRSPWSVFVADTTEYDDFRAFDFREALHAGFGRTWLKGGDGSFKTRMGAGVSFDLNTTTMLTRWVPEGMLGYDFDYRVTDRQRIVSSADYFPDFGNFGHYRLRVRAAYEFLIDPELCLTLRLGIQDRYDSRPGGPGVRRNDLDYFATLLMKF